MPTYDASHGLLGYLIVNKGVCGGGDSEHWPPLLCLLGYLLNAREGG
jgi:hypothetical protein